MVICLERGADLHTAQLVPLPLTVSCSSKIQIGVTFLVPAHPGSPRQRAVKRVCVCVCVCVCCVSDYITHDDASVYYQRQAGTERSDVAAFTVVLFARRQSVPNPVAARRGAHLPSSGGDKPLKSEIPSRSASAYSIHGCWCSG